MSSMVNNVRNLFVNTEFDSGTVVVNATKQRSPKIFCALESGDAREYIPADLLAPPDETWTTCTLTRPTKTRYVMRDENGGFLLAAVVAPGDDSIGIWTFDDEQQANLRDRGRLSPPAYKSSAGAVVQRSRATRRRGLSYSLRLCVGSGFAPPLLELRPTLVQVGDLELRQLKVDLVLSTSTGAHHFKHDPALTRLVSTPNGTRFAPEVSSSNCVFLESQLPRLREGTLVQKFRPGRVTASSSKNYLVFTADRLSGENNVERVDEASLLLGKLRPKTFALDFKFPFSPIQAFAYAIAAFDSKAHLR